MHPDLVRQLSACKSLPTIPAVATEIVRLCKTDDFTLIEMSELLAKDAALTARVLRVANSALYSPRTPVKTVRVAVGILGSNAVMALALGFSLVRVRGDGSSSFDYARFWRRSLLSAISARNLAIYAQLDREELFLAGMFQDVGMLVFDAAMPKYATIAAASENDHLRLARLEREAYRADHTEAGAWIAKQWGLPEYIGTSTLFSHNPTGSTCAPKFAECIAVSGWLAEVWLNEDAAAATSEAAERALTWLGLRRSDVSAVLEENARALPAYSALFEVPLMNEDASSNILADARDALVSITLNASQSAMRSEEKAVTLAGEVRAAEDKSQRDALTGLFGRDHMNATLRLAIRTSKDYKKPLTVAFCDVDHFKKINDTHGHLAGDKVLVTVAKTIQDCLRQLDTVARFGGEEFVALLPHADAAGAAIVTERIRAAIEALTLTSDEGAPIPVTISIGYATSTAEGWQTGNEAEILRVADEAMYLAKRGGRNRVVMHQPKNVPKPKGKSTGRVAR